ncbi:MAG: PAS domain S-box protein, partial [bacterium]
MKLNSDCTTRCRVLIVDDDQKVRALLYDLLEADGYEVMCAADGGSARNSLTTFEPEVVISDVIMPVLDGIELCRYIKNDPKTSSTPVLLISGQRNAPEDSLEGLTAGADEYLNVPFRNEELLVKVARLAERHRAHRALRESEDRYRELFENANDLIYTHDLSGNFTSLNRSGEKLTGYSREEAMRMNIADVVAPDYLAVARQMMGHKTDTDGSTVYELEIVTKTKRRLRLELSTRLIQRDGQAVGVQGVGRDLTERKHSEEALAQQAQREAMTHRISQAIRCSLDSSEIFHTAVNELGSHLKADRCSLFIKDERTQRVRNVAEYHSPGVAPAATDFELEDVRQLIESLDQNGVLCFDDAAHENSIADFYSSILSKAQVRSIMYVAIRVGDQVSAAFALSTTREMRHWSEPDIALAKAVADQTGIAIRQAELYQTAEATSKREVLVNRLTMTIRASLSLPEVLSTAARELGVALSASRVHMRLYDPGDSDGGDEQGPASRVPRAEP